MLGVSARHVERLFETLGLSGISKARVSEICSEPIPLRKSAATPGWAALGTLATTFAISCVRQRYQREPVKSEAVAALTPGCASEITSRAPERPRRDAGQAAPSSHEGTSTPSTSRRPSLETLVTMTTLTPTPPLSSRRFMSNAPS